MLTPQITANQGDFIPVGSFKPLPVFFAAKLEY